jgi:hypothetical protein
MTKIISWLTRLSLPTPILARFSAGPKAQGGFKLCESGDADLVGYFSLFLLKPSNFHVPSKILLVFLPQMRDNIAQYKAG